MMVMSSILVMKSWYLIQRIDTKGRIMLMGSINPAVAVAQQLLLGSAVRQNHALEHATIVLLSKKFPEVRFSGNSTAIGFFIYGRVPTEAILPAAQEALNLLRTTQPELAIHER